MNWSSPLPPLSLPLPLSEPEPPPEGPLEPSGTIWNGLRPLGTPAGQAAGLLPRGRLLPISIVNAYERSYEGEGLAIGGQYGWVDDTTRWIKNARPTSVSPNKVAMMAIISCTQER